MNFCFVQNLTNILKPILRPTIACTLLTLIFGVSASLRVFGGEIILINDGFGWDGVSYKAVVQGLPDLIFQKKLSRAMGQRLLAPLLVNSSLQLAGVDLSDKNILIGFRIHNLIYISLAVFYFMKCLQEMEISQKGQWLGFIAFVMNFGVAKWMFYYPPLIDQFSFLLGVLILYFYLHDKPLGLAVIAFLGIYSYAYISFMAIILFIFPRYDHSDIPQSRKALWINAILSAIIALLIPLSCLTFGYGMKFEGLQLHNYLESRWFSALIQGGYLFIFIFFLFFNGKWYVFNYIFKQSKPLRIIIIFLILGVASAILNSFTTTGGGIGAKRDTVLTFEYLYSLVCQESLAYPGMMLVAHFSFFGPIIALMIIYLKPFFNVIRRYGIGLSIFFTSLIILMLDTESRHLFNSIPFVVAFVIKTIDKSTFPNHFIGVFLALSLFLSRIWFPLNVLEDPEGTTWRIFDTLGPWMRPHIYIFFLAVSFATLIIFSVTLQSERWGQRIRNFYYLVKRKKLE